MWDAEVSQPLADDPQYAPLSALAKPDKPKLAATDKTKVAIVRFMALPLLLI